MFTDLKNITMTGRFCYAFMCIERYLLALYPDVQEEIDDLERIEISHSIELPSAHSLNHFYFDRNRKVPMDKPEPGWGDFEDTEYLSIIL